MATKQTSLQVTLTHKDDDGEQVYKQLPPLPLLLSGHTGVEIIQRSLGPAETWTPDVSGAVGLVVISHDEPFDVDVAGDNASVLESQRLFVAWCDAPSDGTLGTGIAPQIDGNGSTTANIEAWIIRE